MNLNEMQKESLNRVDELINSASVNELLISGESGTGKTATVHAILKYIEDKKLLAKMIGISNHTEPEITLTASTNKAAAVMSQLSGYPTRTIHSLMALRPQVNYKTGECKFLPSENTAIQHNAVIMIDEMSFVDNDTYKIIMENTNNCKIIWIGDHYQLKPVNSRFIPVHKYCNNKVELTEIMRNQGSIQLLGKSLRAAIDTHVLPNLNVGGDVQVLGRKAYLDAIGSAFENRENARIVAWRNRVVLNYNHYIQQDLLGKPALHVGDTYTVNDGIFTTTLAGEYAYYPTDSTVTLRQVVNEDAEMYVVEVTDSKGNTSRMRLPKELNGKNEMLKRLAKEARQTKNWVEYYDVKENVLDLRLPYASTVNKAQGSTHDKVFVDLGDILQCNNPDTVFRMMYVAATRASQELIIYDSTMGE